MTCITISGSIPSGLNAFEGYQVYNCLDACVTAQLVPEMLQHANANHLRTYDREMRLQALCLEMSTKGFPINPIRTIDLLRDLRREADQALTTLHKFCEAVYYPGKLNPNSPLQVAGFFYDFLGIPPVWKWDFKTKERKRDTSRDALEKLGTMYPTAVPFANAILAYRESTKLASVFSKGLEPNGTLRCNFSPSGTETGRLSSQRNPFQRGTNAQNLNDRIRQVVEAPDGFVLAYIDLKTAESIAVGFLSQDKDYIAAALGADLHTDVARLTWRSLAWAEDSKANRAVADAIFYRDFTYRDMAKRGGHATNYLGQPRTVSKHLKVVMALIEDFQQKYFTAFPGIRAWQLDTIARVQREGKLVNPLGRERTFWGRSSDAATHREAVAFLPQSLVADVMNEGLMQVQPWLMAELKGYPNVPLKLNTSVRWSRPGLVAQVHDAGLFLLPTDGLDALLEGILARIVFPVSFGTLGTMEIPADCEVGLRWSKRKDKPGLRDGLMKYKPGQELHFAASTKLLG